MKIDRIYRAALFALALFALTLSSFGADVAPVADAATAPPAWLADLVARFPWLSAVLLAVGVLRVTLKPVFAILHQVTAQTETPADDAFVEKVEQSKPVKWLLFALDWLASVKLAK